MRIERIVVYCDYPVKDRQVAENIRKRLKRLFRTEHNEPEIRFFLSENLQETQIKIP